MCVTEKADYTTAQVATGGNALSATNYEQYTAPASAGDKVIVSVSFDAD